MYDVERCELLAPEIELLVASNRFPGAPEHPCGSTYIVECRDNVMLIPVLSLSRAILESPPEVVVVECFHMKTEIKGSKILARVRF